MVLGEEKRHIEAEKFLFEDKIVRAAYAIRHPEFPNSVWQLFFDLAYSQHRLCGHPAQTK